MPSRSQKLISRLTPAVLFFVEEPDSPAGFLSLKAHMWPPVLSLCSLALFRCDSKDLCEIHRLGDGDGWHYAMEHTLHRTQLLYMTQLETDRLL